MKIADFTSADDVVVLFTITLRQSINQSINQPHNPDVTEIIYLTLNPSDMSSIYGSEGVHQPTNNRPTNQPNNK